MKVLFVISGTERIAASRFRVSQYIPVLQRQGIETTVFSIMSDQVTRLAVRSPEFSRVRQLAYYLLLYTERFVRFWAVIFLASRHTIIFSQRAVFPAWMTWILVRVNPNIIFDIDDAIYRADSQQPTWLIRLKTVIREREVQAFLRASRCVIVENDHIGSYAANYCAAIHKIPGPIDTARYTVRPYDNAHSRITIGWIGSPATTAYLQLLDNVFQEILKIFPAVHIVLVGAGSYRVRERVTKLPWTYTTEIRRLQSFDIGVMPMPDDDWTRGKLGVKMLQYMAVGVPSVVSYTPTNIEIIKDGENGFVARNSNEWIEVLTRLIQDRELRMRIGLAGRGTIEQICSLDKNAGKLVGDLSVVNGGVVSLIHKMIRAALVIVLIIVAMHVPVTTRQGINGVVTVYRIPLYVKICGFLYRDFYYRSVAEDVARRLPDDHQRALALFDWTITHIHPQPDEFDVVDDHVWDIVIRRYGTDDQMADVFTTLASYAGLEAFWIRAHSELSEQDLFISYVKLNGTWHAFDVYNKVFISRGAQEQRVSPNGVPYSAYLRAVDMAAFDTDTKRAEKQKVFPRLIFELRKMMGFVYEKAE